VYCADHVSTVDPVFLPCSCFTRNPIRPDFSGTALVLWILESSVSVSRKIRVMTPNFPWFQSHKNTTFLTVLTPTVGENIHKSRTAVSRPQTGRKTRWRGKCVGSDCRVWTESGKDEERVCKEKSASDLSA
jgi:hypothetical protein